MNDAPPAGPSNGGAPPARPSHRRAPLRAGARARLAVALAAGKAAGTAAKVLRAGGGTSFPGSVARRIDPRVLQKVAGASDARKVIVTGSNGKTTTCRMLAAPAHSGGLKVAQNRPGSTP